MTTNQRRVLVTGGGTFLGDNITAALLTEGVDVTLLVRPEMEERLGILAQRARCVIADVWDPASLRGRARGHQVVIHTVGSMVANPEQGLTHHRLNFVSARNVATMCVSDGVSDLVLMSSVRSPWVGRRYIASKREAEVYLQRVGVQGTIIRAPLAYVRGGRRPFFYQLMTFLGSFPPPSWLGFGKFAPMPVDMLARGVARVALNPSRKKTIYYAPDLRRLNIRDEARGTVSMSLASLAQVEQQNPQDRVHPFELLDDETPFGWIPTEDRDR